MTRTFPGRFNDGRTAASRAVTVSPNPAGLEIRGEDGLLVAFWKLADLRADGQLPGSQGVRLRCAAEPDSRLALPDGEFIREVAPSIQARTQRKSRSGWMAVATAAALLAASLGIIQGLPAASRSLSALVPPALEREWGAKLSQGIEQRWGTCRAPAGSAALALLVDRLGTALPEDARPARVAVVRAADSNALALPGGTILIFQGLVENARSPDEIAGVLAHEMTHIAERHVTAAMIRGFGVGLLVTLVTGDSSGMMAAGAAALLAGAYSREDEAQADLGAVRLLDQAGIGAEGLAGFFDRLAGQGGIPAWLSTHPESATRAAAIRSAARAADAPPALSAEQWADLRAICG